jgi:predicted nucleotidyltransferase
MERKVLLKTLFGSHNYNLNDKDSDKDYKIFVAPTFDDLYNNKMYSASYVGKSEDWDAHDIRKLSDVFWKSNINFLEILYSKEFSMKESNADTAHLISKIYDMRDEIVTMNLPYFYNACKGMYFNKMGYLDKGTEGTQHLIQKYGYCTKNALHAFRVLDFIERFASCEFKNFQWAMTYDEYDREKLLNIKYGQFTKEEFIAEMNIKLKRFETHENYYKSQPIKEDVREELTNIIKEIVKINI